MSEQQLIQAEQNNQKLQSTLFSLVEIEDFRQYLNLELDRRIMRNPRYSLRSFARFLEVDSSALSKMLRGKRPLGRKMIRQLGPRLGLNADEVLYYQKRAKRKSTGPKALAHSAGSYQS